ncbi:MAG: hypothetical protein GWN71_44300, partial [Gammaproteobacteria bacterium]|nr:hypothetical protein [Gemmatimonadota bacterium]NIU80312.1 hypothetical protein [Gammaproteobacteria bacterium]NIX25784.1 hypothetical protein [Actinomycetota bacterium]
GEDLAAWRFEPNHVLIWTHDDRGRPLATLPAATRAHLRRHEAKLRGRCDLRASQPVWSLFRVRPEKLGRRVAWRDIAVDPGAVVIPERVPFLGSPVPAVSLNTVYGIPADSDDMAHLLAGILNSTPARAYLKSIAERASGGH